MPVINPLKPRTWIPILGGLGGISLANGLTGDIFVSSGTSTPRGPSPAAWAVVDTTLLGVPADAKCVDVQGEFIITGGTAYTGLVALYLDFALPSRIANLVPGNSSEMYVECTGSNAGNRTPGSRVVPLENGKFAYAWKVTGPPQLGWPAYPSCGLNFMVTRYMR